MKIEETGQKRITLSKYEVENLLEKIRDDFDFWDVSFNDAVRAIRKTYAEKEFSFLTDAEEN